MLTKVKDHVGSEQLAILVRGFGSHGSDRRLLSSCWGPATREESPWATGDLMLVAERGLATGIGAISTDWVTTGFSVADLGWQLRT